MFKADDIIVGLRVDVDTLRGTKRGVPALVALLARHQIRASFFFSVGPDNMGRNLWRLLRPTFLNKMLRSKAASLYGWDILFKGTFWPGPDIGAKAADEIRQAARAGHEIGFHAWDHHRWQTKIDTLRQSEIEHDTRRGLARLAAITGQTVDCAAAPAWRLSAAALASRASFPLRYASDCRGESIFRPLGGGLATVSDYRVPQMREIGLRAIASLCEQADDPPQGGINSADAVPCNRLPPQVPVTLPTFDEVIGQGEITLANYNETLIQLLRPGRLNVLTIHAEAEGVSCLGLFADFLKQSAQRGVGFMALGDLVAGCTAIPTAPMLQKELPGRDGWLSWQGPTVNE